MKKINSPNKSAEQTAERAAQTVQGIDIPTPETDAMQFRVQNAIGGESTVVSFLLSRNLERGLMATLAALKMAERELTDTRQFCNHTTPTLQHVRATIEEVTGKPF